MHGTVSPIVVCLTLPAALAMGAGIGFTVRWLGYQPRRASIRWGAALIFFTMMCLTAILLSILVLPTTGAVVTMTVVILASGLVSYLPWQALRRQDAEIRQMLAPLFEDYDRQWKEVSARLVIPGTEAPQHPDNHDDRREAPRRPQE